MTTETQPEAPMFRHFTCTLPDGTQVIKRSRFAEFTKVIVTLNEAGEYGVFRWTSSEKTAKRDLRLAKKADGVEEAVLIDCEFSHEDAPEMPEGVFTTKKEAMTAAKEAGLKAKDVEKTDAGWVLVTAEAQAS